ncbi:MAG: CDP-alcohol phosphatidyltransferase family protein [Anaerolineales bacterium]|nr:CDP-alcohol phosphatidyltransferase family protein [Anaerolineales bacterium]
MKSIAGSRPNPFTWLRLLALPALWALALTAQDLWLAVGLLAAILTDMLDGWLARRDPRYAAGDLDALADKALALSVAGWLALRRPAIWRAHPALLLCAAGLYAALLVYSRVKFGRVSTLHLHSGKVGGLLQAVFVLHALFSGGYSPPLFYLALGSFCFAAAEELLILLTHTTVDPEQVRSLWPWLKARWLSH